MKIAVVVSTFPPYRGGMGNMARSYALGLSGYGHDVEVFCPAYRHIGGEPAAPYKVHRLKAWGNFRNSAFLPQLFARLSRFDVVNLHYPFYGGAESVLFNKKIRGAKQPLVVNYQMDSVGKGWVGAAMAGYRNLLLPSVLKAADKVIVTSPDYAAHSAAARTFRRHREKFTAVPPGVDTSVFAPRPKSPELLSRYGFRPQDRVVLFVGGLDRAHAFKGVDFLLETWAEAKPREAKLLVVGRGDLRERYLRTATDRGIEAEVVFDDGVGENGLPAVYNLADLFVLPSVDRSEAFGIVLIEALASGLPVLASNLPGVRSVIENGRNGFTFGVKDRADLSARLTLCLEDEPLRRRMASAAREIAVSKYEQTAVWAEVERVFKSAAAGSTLS
ncbi:MAG: glycosyltransferase family 4 protein [Candidatus Aminicenantes bacterium]|nr:glycosyltransferase family 4 protein [Candidatus Aminicenantes bacterium]